MSVVGLLNLNLGVPDHYEIPKFSDPGSLTRPLGAIDVLDAPNVANVPVGRLGGSFATPLSPLPNLERPSLDSLQGSVSWTTPSPRPELLSDHPWKLPSNGFTQALGLTYDPTEGAIRQVLADPNQPRTVHALAGVADIALNLRNFATTPLRAAIGLGNMAHSGYTLIADLGGPHSDVAWKELVLNPGERALNAVGAGLSKYWSSPPSNWGAMVEKDLAHIGNTVTREIQQKRDRGDWGGATGDFLALPVAGMKVAQRVLMPDIVAGVGSDVALPTSEWFARPVSEQMVQRGWYNGRTWEVYPPDKMSVAGRLEFAKGMQLPENYQRLGVANALQTSYGFLLKDPLVAGPASMVERLLRSEIGGVERSGPMPGVAGGRLVPNFDGVLHRNNETLQLFGTKLDAGGNPVFKGVGDNMKLQPNLPPGVALIDHMFAPGDPGAVKTALNFALDLAKEAGHSQALIYTRSGPAITQMERLGLPYEFRVAGTSVEPYAADGIWNHWSRVVHPDNWKTQLPPTWSEAFAEGDDLKLLAEALNRPALHTVDPLTGMSEYGRMTHNLALLRSNNPVSTLAGLPQWEQQLVDGGLLFGGAWKLNPRGVGLADPWSNALGRVGSYFDPLKTAGKLP